MNAFLILEGRCEEAIAWVVSRVGGAGLQVVCTFDLRVARHDSMDCPCPHHGTHQCDCQMVVMLVYGHGDQPVSLVAHSYDGTTWFSLVDRPGQSADPRLERAIREALPLDGIPSVGGDHPVQATRGIS